MAGIDVSLQDFEIALDRCPGEFTAALLEVTNNATAPTLICAQRRASVLAEHPEVVPELREEANRRLLAEVVDVYANRDAQQAWLQQHLDLGDATAEELMEVIADVNAQFQLRRAGELLEEFAGRNDDVPADPTH